MYSTHMQPACSAYCSHLAALDGSAVRAGLHCDLAQLIAVAAAAQRRAWRAWRTRRTCRGVLRRYSQLEVRWGGEPR